MQTGTLDIPAATATPADVLSGATFFAGDTTEIQTGTLALTGNATAAQVLSGYTFYNTDAKTKVTGTLTGASVVKQQTGSIAISSKNTPVNITTTMDGITMVAVYGALASSYSSVAGAAVYPGYPALQGYGGSLSISVSGKTISASLSGDATAASSATLSYRIVGY